MCTDCLLSCNTNVYYVNDVTKSEPNFNKSLKDLTFKLTFKLFKRTVQILNRL